MKSAMSFGIDGSLETIFSMSITALHSDALTSLLSKAAFVYSYQCTNCFPLGDVHQAYVASCAVLFSDVLLIGNSRSTFCSIWLSSSLNSSSSVLNIMVLREPNRVACPMGGSFPIVVGQAIGPRGGRIACPGGGSCPSVVCWAIGPRGIVTCP